MSADQVLIVEDDLSIGMVVRSALEAEGIEVDVCESASARDAALAGNRYDLMLTDVTGWVTKDLADFLVGRTAQPRSRFEVISPDAPLALDRGLGQNVARQFRGDYAAIGLHTRLILSGRSRNS